MWGYDGASGLLVRDVRRDEALGGSTWTVGCPFPGGLVMGMVRES